MNEKGEVDDSHKNKDNQSENTNVDGETEATHVKIKNINYLS